MNAVSLSIPFPKTNENPANIAKHNQIYGKFLKDVDKDTHSNLIV